LKSTLRLSSNDPAAQPLIDPKYYDDPRDLEVMAAGLNIARELGRANAFAEWRGLEVVPGDAINYAAGVRDYVRRSLLTYFHPVGTCRIGQDDTAVVDTDLRVHGIAGLRVADASVMPSIGPPTPTRPSMPSRSEPRTSSGGRDSARFRPWRLGR
jgi:choline dehydrogenase